METADRAAYSRICPHGYTSRGDHVSQPVPDLRLHLLTADTYGTAHYAPSHLGATLELANGGEHKRAYVERLGATRCVAIGNGVSDGATLGHAAIGIAVLEGMGQENLEEFDAVRAGPEPLEKFINRGERHQSTGQLSADITQERQRHTPVHRERRNPRSRTLGELSCE
jgi:hypothetical protein